MTNRFIRVVLRVIVGCVIGVASTKVLQGLGMTHDNAVLGSLVVLCLGLILAVLWDWIEET